MSVMGLKKLFRESNVVTVRYFDDSTTDGTLENIKGAQAVVSQGKRGTPEFRKPRPPSTTRESCPRSRRREANRYLWRS